MFKMTANLIASILLSTALSSHAMAAESGFTCKHNQRTDFWIQNKNPIIFSNGVRISVIKNLSASAPTNPKYATSVDGKKMYMYGNKAGNFGGLTHYQVCTKTLK